MKKNHFFSAPLLILGIMLAFGFAGCEPTPKEDLTLSEGTYNGVPTGARTSTNETNQTLNSAQNAGALDNMTAPLFTIVADGTMIPAFSDKSANPFLAVGVGVGHGYRFVLGSSNKLTLEIKLIGGASWEDWNTRNAHPSGDTVVKSLSGSFNPGTGKVTLTFTYTELSSSDSSSRTYVFTKQ